MTLAKRLLNNPGLIALTLPEERAEIRAALSTGPVVLKRTFNMPGNMKGEYIRFWRVVGPANHPNYQSDLSIEGLKEWGVIQNV